MQSMAKMLVNTSALSSSKISDQYYVINWDQPTTDITDRFRSCSLRLWICSSVTFGFVWTQHVDLCQKNIYISRGFDFPYFRSSPLSISPAAEWHHIFLLNCLEKRTIFGTVCTSNSKKEYSRELLFVFPLEIGYLHLVTQICANRSSFWQNKGFVLHVCVASSDNRS